MPGEQVIKIREMMTKVMRLCVEEYQNILITFTQLDQAKRQNDVNKITELTIKYIKMMQEKQADA